MGKESPNLPSRNGDSLVRGPQLGDKKALKEGVFGGGWDLIIITSSAHLYGSYLLPLSSVKWAQVGLVSYLSEHSMNLSYSQHGARHKIVASSSLSFPINEPPFCHQVMYKDFQHDEDRDLESSRISSTEQN